MQSFVNETSTVFCEIKPFEFFINYAELDPDSPENILESHFHDRCEIYINVSGDISYMVEKHLYTLNNGDIVITKPFEYHNCVYNSAKLHRQYCLSFIPEGNEELFSFINERLDANGSLVRLTNDRLEEVFESCNILLSKELSQLERYALFTRILVILGSGTSKEHHDMMPESIRLATDYIAQNITEQITVADIARVTHVSVNTLERHFKEIMGVSPAKYLKNKRLANAARMLRKGSSVTDACFDSGFINCSHFIVQFKKHFGITPNKYRSQTN